MERKNTKAHDLAFFFSICLLQIIACQVRRTVGIYGCNLIESWHCSSKVLEVHVYSILAAIKYHFQIHVSPGLTLMLQLGVVYIYILLLSKMRKYFSKTQSIQWLTPIRIKFDQPMEKILILTSSFLKKLPLSLVISGIRKKISSTTLLRHVVFRGVGRGLWFWINFLWIPVRILKGPMRRVRVHSSWQNDYFTYINK